MTSLCSNNIKESLSEAWTRFKDLLQKVPHHGIDLWLQVQIFYDHVNPATRRAIDQSAGNVPSASDRRLIDLENQVQQLMEAHLALKQPIQVKKISSSCEICSGPHNTQYCMENPEQAFVDYASSRTDETGGDSEPFDTLADLGACINIIPLYLFKKLNIELLEETDHDFGLADGGQIRFGVTTRITEKLHKSVDNFEELSQKFLEEFSQQKRYAKDPTEIHGIKRRQNEGLQAFMDRFKSESSHINGVPLVLRISAFMHGHSHPELAKKLNDKIPKTVDEMFKRVRAFIRGEVVVGSA
ncbi:hypothetical protein Tco_0319157 [Tanacetum coccineum]